MSLRKQERTVVSMEQLGSYIDAGKGEIKGRLWFLIEEDGGSEQECGTSGVYSRTVDSGNGASIIFTPHPESMYMSQLEEITPEMISERAIRVISRKRIKL